MNERSLAPPRKPSFSKTAFPCLTLAVRAGAWRRVLFVLALAALASQAQMVSAQTFKPDGNGGGGGGGTTTVVTEVGVWSSGSPSVYVQPVTLSVGIGPPTCGQNAYATVYDNGASIGRVTFNSSGIGYLTTNSLAVGTHSITASFSGNIVGTLTCLAETSGTPITQVVNANTGYEGLLVPKFLVLDVIYAPPGCAAPCNSGSSSSSVQYSNTTTAGNTSTNSSSFSNSVSWSESSGASQTIPGKWTSTVYGGAVNTTNGSSQDTTETSTSSTTVMLSKAATASDTVGGFPTGSLPGGIPSGDHAGDWDEIELWLNPELDYMVYPECGGSVPCIQFLGYAWDPGVISGNPTFGGIFHAYVPVGCLNGDWESDGNSDHANTCANVQNNLNRNWAPSEDQGLQSPTGGALTASGCSPQTSNSPSICPNTTDAYQILQADPLAYNPGSGYQQCSLSQIQVSAPQTACNGQYTLLCWSPNNQPNSNPTSVCPNSIDYLAGNQPAFNLTYIYNAQTTTGESTSIATSVTVSQDANDSFLGVFGVSSTYTQTNTVTQTSGFQNTLTQTQTLVDAYTVKPDSPSYEAPGYLVYQDNLFGTFAFVPYNP